MKKELLMKKYQTGELGPEEQQILESYIEKGIIELDELDDLDKIHKAVNPELEHIPSQQMKDRFYTMLTNQKQKDRHFNLWTRLWNAMSGDLPTGQLYRLAYSLVILLIGLAGGWLISPVNKYQEQLSDINGEVHQLKEMMMLSMLDEPSATDRLKAVNMSSELPQSYGKVVDALINTLNNDENVNVRLAALDALRAYTNDPTVREKLIMSINIQESPLVQIELADLMVLLQEKRSVDELRKIIEKEGTDPTVKDQLEESINKLI